MHISPDVNGNTRRNIVDISFILDNSPLESYILEEAEVYAICKCPVDELIKAHTLENYSFPVTIFTNKSERLKIHVDRNAFPYNWDNYHFKIALLAKRFLVGETNLVY